MVIYLCRQTVIQKTTLCSAVYAVCSAAAKERMMMAHSQVDDARM